jgi:uncharacterized protein
MYAFEDLDAVHAALNMLMRREPPLVKVLPRQPGTKESRYMHLFAGDVAPGQSVSERDSDSGGQREEASSANPDRICELEEEVEELRRELETLREQFAAFQKQFQ